MAYPQGTFTLPANIRFGATAFANSSGMQVVNVLVDGNPVAQFQGQSTGNEVIGSQVLSSGSGKVQVTVSVNGQQSSLVSAQVVLANKLNVIVIGSEDGTDNDYNDSVVILNWPLG